MKRVNQMRLYRLGYLTRLRSLKPGGEVGFETQAPIVASIAILNDFIQNEDNRQLGAAVERAKPLYAELHRVWNESFVYTEAEITTIQHLLQRFETSLEDDLDRLPTYIVDPVGAYSFGQLINRAETVFTEGMRTAGEIPAQAILDFRSAGRCLAFDLPTACGFHAIRAADAMIHEYYAHFAGTTPKQKPRNWGAYIRILRQVLNTATAARKPNERTIELLDSIRKVDRDPVVHPELDLDSETALAMFDMCKNAITFMVFDIRAAP